MRLKFDLTHNNHFRWGYDGTNEFQLRTSDDQKWTASYSRCSRIPETFDKECIRAAKLIAQKTKDDIWLFYSGGIDSEFMLYCFLKAGVKFKIAILEFKGDLNIYDVSRAKDFCDSNGLKYYLFTLDVVKWWEENLLKYAIPHQCISPQIPVMWWLMEQIDGHPVLGVGNQTYRKDLNDGIFYLWEGEKVQSHSRYLIANNRPGVHGFFRYTPEQMLSFLLFKTNMMLFSYSEQMDLISNLQLCIKAPVYTHYFPMKYREKCNGFEKIQELNDYWSDMLHTLMPASYGWFLTSPQKIMSYLIPEEMTRVHMNKRAFDPDFLKGF
jgi:hypothetical protein